MLQVLATLFYNIMKATIEISSDHHSAPRLVPSIFSFPERNNGTKEKGELN